MIQKSKEQTQGTMDIFPCHSQEAPNSKNSQDSQEKIHRQSVHSTQGV